MPDVDLTPIIVGLKGDDPALLDAARRQTVQDLPNVSKDGASSLWLYATPRGPILPAWGTRDRERVLRLYDRHDYNSLWQGATANLCKKWAGTGWKIKGGRNRTNYFQEVFRSAQFGAGWTQFMKRAGRDYLRFDGGLYIEVIAPGDPRKPPTGPITGLAVLDSYYCWPTGDPDFPVIYWSRFGKLHTLHKSRVIHVVDAPDSDQFNPGYGLCALSRAISVVERQLFMNRYIVSNLDDKPSPGVVIANNIDSKIRDQMAARYQQEQSSDAPPPWGSVMWIYNLDPSKPATLDNFTFSRPPEKFDYPVYVQIDVDDMALAIGVDPQDLRPLSSRSMGSAAQTEALHEKANGKTYGDFLIELERAFNTQLPDELEFEFDTRDSIAAESEAKIATLWAGIGQIIAPLIGNQATAQVLADNVEAFQNVLVDEAGQIVQLTDLDPQPADVSHAVNAQLPPTPTSVPGKPGGATTATDATPMATGKASKAIQATRLDFENEFADVLQLARSKGIDRNGFAAILRQLLNQYITSAYSDGLKDGGVADGVLDPDDQAEALSILAQQNQYVRPFADVVFGKGLSDVEAEGKPALWYNGSIQRAYDAGRGSADRNGYYTFHLGSAEQHCKDCPRLDGQTHRWKDWQRRNLLPGIVGQSTECGGYRCQCKVTRADPGVTASGHF